MIFTKEGLKKALREVLYDGGKGRQKIEELNQEVEVLKVTVKDLELKKRLEEEEIKHLVKMKEEKQLIELQKKEITLQQEFTKKEMELQTKYHDKVLTTIDESRKESKELYTEIMKRLPNVNVDIARG